MMIHATLVGSGQSSLDLSTCRVTISKDGRRFGFPGETVLLIGTLPNLTAIPMSRVESFWVEED
jgi:hypothetical protein